MVIDAIRDCVKDLWESLSEHECPSCGVKFNDNDPWQTSCGVCREFAGCSSEDSDSIFRRYDEKLITREQFIQFRDKILADARIKDEIHKQRQVASLKKRWQVK
jgi:CRISPR/Cas system CSM-associated protein Csm3 (group 7 of RAMP superfamily)